MTSDFTADVWLFEDIHGLQQQGVGKADRGGQFFNFLTSREVSKHGIEIVKRLADLVDRLFFFILERAETTSAGSNSWTNSSARARSRSQSARSGEAFEKQIAGVVVL